MDGKFSLVDRCTLICGKTASGKSVLCRWLVRREKSAFSKIFCVCPTERVNRFWQESGIVLEQNVFDEYDNRWCEQLIDRASRINAKHIPGDKQRVLVILDDVVSDANLHTASGLKKLFTRGRHVCISVICLTQYICSVPPVFRVNATWVFCGSMNRQSLTVLTDQYLIPSMTPDEFRKMYQNACKGYGFLVIMNQSVDDDDPNSVYGVIHTPPSEVD